MKDRARTLYNKALKAWTIAKQIFMYFEESAELQTEVAKYERWREYFDMPNNWDVKGLQLHKIADEIADTQIMIEQLQVIYDIEENVKERYEYKLNRLEKRLEKSQ